jgi:3-phytase/alkaline phosphatase D
MCLATTLCVAAAVEETFAQVEAVSVEVPNSEFPNGVAAGDVDQSSAVLWARAGIPGNVIFEIGTDPCFTSILQALEETVTEPMIPAKVKVRGLDAGTRYFYRACLDSCSPPADCSPPSSGEAWGRFRTPLADGSSGVRFGVSSCWQDDMRPLAGFQNIPARDLDFFVALGDTVYADNRVTGCPKTPMAVSLDDFRCAHEVAVSSRTGGRNVLAEVRASTSIYATIDDHEVRDNFAGGGALVPGGEFCQSGPKPCWKLKYVNETNLYKRGLRAFEEYHPIAHETYSTGLRRLNAGKQKLYRYRTFGTDAAIMVLDARSFRDSPVKRDRSKRSSMLGDVQLQDLIEDLQDAQDRGITWKFVMVSVPIQNLGPLSLEKVESYAIERRKLLDFIVTEGIDNVVFVSGDLHGTLVNNLIAREAGPNIYTRAWDIITGPGGHVPMGHDLTKKLPQNVRKNYESLPRAGQDLFIEQLFNKDLDALNLPQIGLCGPGIPAKLLEGSYVAANTNGWTEFEIDAVTQKLMVTTYGVPWYAADAYRPSQPNFILDTHRPEVVSRFEVRPADSTGPGPVNLGDCTSCKPGESCLLSQDCCGSNVCEFAVCIPRRSLSDGSLCTDADACHSGVCFLGLCGCQDTTEICGSTGDCCGNDVCSTQVCVGPGSLPALTPCSLDAACRSGSCTAGTCDNDCGDGFCDGVERCGDSNATIECQRDCGLCENDSVCLENGDCRSGYCTLGFCVPCQGSGELCLTDDQCCSNSCRGVPLTCQSLKSNGATCSRDGQCSSGNCCGFTCRGRSCLGASCSRDRDCDSGNCILSRCAP